MGRLLLSIYIGITVMLNVDPGTVEGRGLGACIYDAVRADAHSASASDGNTADVVSNRERRLVL